MTAYNTVKTALESADLTDEAKDVILTIIDEFEDDEDVTVTEFREALEDGECLDSFGFEDDDQEAIEDAHEFLEGLESEVAEAAANEPLYVFYRDRLCNHGEYVYEQMTKGDFAFKFHLGTTYDDWYDRGGMLDDVIEFTDKEEAAKFAEDNVIVNAEDVE